jgi:hypothetical protein
MFSIRLTTITLLLGLVAATPQADTTTPSPNSAVPKAPVVPKGEPKALVVPKENRKAQLLKASLAYKSHRTS